MIDTDLWKQYWHPKCFYIKYIITKKLETMTFKF